MKAAVEENYNDKKRSRAVDSKGVTGKTPDKIRAQKQQKKDSGVVLATNTELGEDEGEGLYPELGALFSGIKGDFEMVLNTGVSMFSGAFSFFHDNVTAEAEAAGAGGRGKGNSVPIPMPIPPTPTRTSKNSSNTNTSRVPLLAAGVGAGAGTGNADNALKRRLPSMWGGSAPTPIKSTASSYASASAPPRTDVPTPVVCHTKPKATVAPAVRVKEGDVVNLGILSTTTSLASFICGSGNCNDDETHTEAEAETVMYPNQVLIVGNMRMIMTKVLSSTSTDTEADAANTDTGTRMAKVLWSQALADLSASQVTAHTPASASQGQGQGEGVHILHFSVHSSAKTMSLALSSMSACEEILTVIRAKRSKHLPDSGVMEVLPLIRVTAPEPVSVPVQVPTHVDTDVVLPKPVISTSPVQSPVSVPAPAPAFVMLTPGSYCQVDICVRQFKHGVGEVGVRTKLVNDGMSVTQADIVVENAKKVINGAQLSLVPGKRKVRLVASSSASASSSVEGSSDADDTHSTNIEKKASDINTEIETEAEAKVYIHAMTAVATPVGGEYIIDVGGGISPCRAPKEQEKEVSDSSFADVQKQLLRRFRPAASPPTASINMDTVPVPAPAQAAVVAVDDPAAIPPVAGVPVLAPTCTYTYATHPVYSKYFKMLKVGLPIGSVKNKMLKEGVDPAVLDRSPNSGVEETQGDGTNNASASTSAGKRKAEQQNPQQQQQPLSLVDMLLRSGASTGSQIAPQSAKKPAPRKKKFHWAPLDSASVGASSMWAEFDDGEGATHGVGGHAGRSGGIDIDEEEFNSLFVQRLSPKRPTRPSSVTAHAINSKPDTVYLIDMKRGQNAAIALARIKISYSELRSMVTRLDGSQLTADQLQSIVDYLPTAEESAVLLAYKGQETLLGQAEKFMLEMSRCPTPLAAKCLACLQFQHHFPAKLTEMNRRVELLQRACASVQESARLKKVLKTVLQVGNQMNGGSVTGKFSVGFAFESLLKLSSAKAFDNKTSLLQYIVLLLHRHDGDALHFPDDLKNMSECARLTMSMLLSEREDLRKGVVRAREDMANMFPLSSSSSSSSSSPLLTFLQDAELSLEALDTATNALTKQYTDMLVYFGQDTSQTSDVFFSTLSKFVSEFSSTRDTYVRQKKAEEARELRAAKFAAATAVVSKANSMSDTKDEDKENKVNLAN